MPIVDPAAVALIRVLPCFVLLGGVAFLAVRRLLGLTVTEAIVVGPASGIAAWIAWQRLLDVVGIPLFPFAAPVTLVSLAAAAFLIRPADQLRGPASPWLIAVPAASLVLLLTPMAWQALPAGWDPAFHSLLAEIVARGNSLPLTWAPFEVIPVTMPSGIHGILAAIHEFTGTSTTRVFQVALAIGVAWSAGIVGLFAARESPRAGIWAAAIYAFGASFCALDYIRWGGLGNAWGMLIALTGVWLIVDDAGESVAASRREMTGELMIGAVGLVHHHAMLAAWLMLAAAAFTEFRAGRPRFRERWVRIVTMSAGASIPVVLHFASRLGSVAATSVFRYQEELSMLRSPAAIVEALGWPLVFALVIFAVTWRRTLTAHAVIAQAGILLLVFVLARYGYGVWSLITTGEPADAFSAVRFFSDSVYFLAMAGGIGIARLHRGTLPSWVKQGATVALVVACAIHVGRWLDDRRTETTSADVLYDMKWLRDRTEPSALIVSESHWVPALTRREATYTPLPASEMVQAEAVGFKRATLAQGGDPLVNFAHSTNRPVYVYVAGIDESAPGIESILELCTRAGAIPIYRFKAADDDRCPR